MIRNPSDLWRGWLCACQFLTRLPVPALRNFQASDQGHALPLFPWVGLLIGMILGVTGYLLQPWLSAPAIAALLVALWALVTGGLHLDGLGDSADGWLAGGNRERTLEIMKDPRCGSAAVIAIACVLLLQFALLQTVVVTEKWWVLMLAPLLGRAGALTLLLTTPYVSPRGIGEDFLHHSSRTQLRASVALSWLLALLLLPLTAALLAAVVWLLLLLALRHVMMQRLQGTSGDTCGALIAVLESALLVCAAI